MTRTKSESRYRNWQAKKDKVSFENAPKFYEIEKQLWELAIKDPNIQEEIKSPRQEMIESRSRCFCEMNRKTNRASLESICVRLANLTTEINK